MVEIMYVFRPNSQTLHQLAGVIQENSPKNNLLQRTSDYFQGIIYVGVVIIKNKPPNSIHVYFYLQIFMLSFYCLVQRAEFILETSYPISHRYCCCALRTLTTVMRIRTLTTVIVLLFRWLQRLKERSSRNFRFHVYYSDS